MAERRLLRKIVQVIGPMKGVLAIVLYGSMARGDYGPRSDVDLLVIVREPGQARLVRQRLAEQDFGRQLQPTVRSVGQLRKTDAGLLGNIFREGKVLYLREPLDLPAASLLNLKPFNLYSFDLKGLTQPRKARFNRMLYPHRTSQYRYPGLLAELGGARVSSGCFLLPQASAGRMERLLRRHHVSFRSRRIWT